MVSLSILMINHVVTSADGTGLWVSNPYPGIVRRASPTFLQRGGIINLLPLFYNNSRHLLFMELFHLAILLYLYTHLYHYLNYYQDY